MNIRKHMALACAALFAAQLAAAPFEITIRDGSTNALYRLGEVAHFTLVAKDLAADAASSGGVVKVTMDGFGEKALETREWKPADEPVLTVSGTRNDPGFLRVKAISRPRTDGALWALGPGNCCWSVGYEPESIKPVSPRPSDFDAYWAGEQARLAREVPLDPRRERVEWKCDESFSVWKVNFATFGGKRVWGFLVQPKGLDGVQLPLYVNIPGAGPALSEAGTQSFKKPGEIHLIMNVHPYEPAKDIEGQKALYKAQDAECEKKYGCNYAIAGGAVSREEFFFHDAILGIDRAVSWAAELPSVDRERVRYSGGSQGGGLGIALCALNPAVSRACIYVTALSDMCGYKVGRQSGWPLLVERQKNERSRAAAEAIAPYFDAAHFAPRVKIPVRFAVGFSDTTCPPPCVYSAYNALGTTDKAISIGLGMGHATRPDIRGRMEKWLRE